MELKTIFANDLGLLENKSVQALLSYVKEQHEVNVQRNQSYRQQEFAILDIFMNSELIAKGGTPSRIALEKIGDVLNYPTP